MDNDSQWVSQDHECRLLKSRNLEQKLTKAGSLSLNLTFYDFFSLILQHNMFGSLFIC